MMNDSFEMISIAENIEADMREKYWALMGDNLAQKLKAKTLRIKGTLLTIMGKSSSLQMNRVINAGVQDAMTKETIDEIIDCYKAAKIKRFSFHLSPGPNADIIKEWLQKRHFRLKGHFVKLIRGTSTPMHMKTDLTVKRIGKKYADRFAEIICENTALPVRNIPWIAATVSQPGFYHFMAFDNDNPAATGLLYLEQTCGWLGFGTTLTSYRNHGAQSAIIAVRIKLAHKLGCEWVCSETLEPLPGRPATSYRNLLRNGFEVAYKRPIYLWQKM